MLLCNKKKDIFLENKFYGRKKGFEYDVKLNILYGLTADKAGWVYQSTMVVKEDALLETEREFHI